jgi:hypothetical protein
MVSALSSVDRAFEPRSGQTKYYKIGIGCFSAMHAALKITSKDWLEIMIMCPKGRHVYLATVVSVTSHYTNQTKRVGLEQNDPHFIEY